MKKSLAPSLSAALLCAGLCSGCLSPPRDTWDFHDARLAHFLGARGEQEAAGEKASEKSAWTEKRPGFFHVVLLYIPNRVFDALDLVRFRVRVGPGLSLSARATEPASAYLGGHTAVYAGLPGPRGGRTIPLPVGLEGEGGAKLSLVDATKGVHYGFTEIGVGTQLAIIGFDVGVDPLLELLDLLGGIVTVDPARDDL